MEGVYRSNKRGYPLVKICSLEIQPVPQRWKASAPRACGLEAHGLQSWWFKK